MIAKFKKDDKVLIYDEDANKWKLGLILDVRPHNDYIYDYDLWPIHVPDDLEPIYFIQFIEGDPLDMDNINGVYTSVDYIESSDYIIKDTPLARILYLDNNYEK